MLNHLPISAGDTVTLLNSIRPNVVYSEEENLELIQKALGHLNYKPVIVSPKPQNSHLNFQEWLTNDPNLFELEPIQNIEDHISCVMLTSGTTGIPKGILLRDKALNIASQW